MDNFNIDVTSEGTVSLGMALSLAFSRHRTAEGFRIIEEGRTLTDKWRPATLVFYWVKLDKTGYHPLPFKMDAAKATEFAAAWLEQVDYGREPDHDGDNGKGWRVYTEGWGHVDSDYQAIVAVQPAWAMYGK